jgi:hypothetical protein
MNRFKVVSFLLLLMIGPIISSDFVHAQTLSAQISFREQFRLEEGTVRYYVATLNETSVWTLNCTGIYEGVFYLFIFQNRPRQGFIDPETKNISSEMYENAVAYNNTPTYINSTVVQDLSVSYIELTYTIPKTGLYYMCVVIVENAPDTFLLESNYELQPYFIPFIPGYPTEWIGICSTIMIIGLIQLKKKKVHLDSV